MNESPFSESTKPGRIVSPTTQVNRTGWIHWFPGLETLRHYQSSWLRHDLSAGLVMTTMLVPVGIAYAEASGVPGINGLYATIVPLLAYALFGPSRILVLGPDSALAPVILAVVLPLSAGETHRAATLAGMMAIVSGVVCVTAGLCRLGFITELLSKPIRYGYMNGIALTVLLSQVPKLFGFSVSAKGPVRQAWGIFQKIFEGKTNIAALSIGASTLVLILLLKRKPRLPGVPCLALCPADCHRLRFLSSKSKTGCQYSWAASRSLWFHLLIRVCFLEPMRRVFGRRLTRTKKWWA